jgi:hypothetical protein
LKRQLAALLVSEIRVDSLNESGKPAPAAEVPYGFAAIATRTGTRADSSQGDPELQRTYTPGCQMRNRSVSPGDSQYAHA